MELTIKEKELFKNRFFELTSLEDVEYYYHVTEKDMEEVIFNEGLIMKEKELYTKMIPIDYEIKYDPIAFVLDEKNRGINRTTGSIILIGILNEDLPYVVRENNNISNSQFLKSDNEYNFDPQYIVGSIDIESLTITLNQEYYLASDIDYHSNYSLY